jgi:Transglutaminase-like superfamily
MTGWTVALCGLRARTPLGRLVSLVRPRVGAATGSEEASADRILALAQTVARLVSRSPETLCLVRSLVAYRYLCLSGIPCELHIGFSREHRLAGHAWIVIDGRVVSDDPIEIQRYTPVMAFAADGQRRTA